MQSHFLQFSIKPRTNLSTGVGLGGDNLEKENVKPEVKEEKESLVSENINNDVVEMTEQVGTIQLTEEEQARLLCSLENKEACMMCSG